MKPTDIKQMPASPFPRIVANNASCAWGFNCGPGALAGLLHCTPEVIRPHLLDLSRRDSFPALASATRRAFEVRDNLHSKRLRTRIRHRTPRIEQAQHSACFRSLYGQ